MRLTLAVAAVLGCTLAAGGSASTRPAQECSGSSATCAVLTVTIQGQGTVSTPAGTCSSGGVSATCTQSFPLGTAVTPTATPLPGAVFSGWSGACTGKASCSLTMSAPRSLTATFAGAPPPPELELKSLGAPVVRTLSVGYSLTIRFSATRAGTGRLRIVGSGRQVGTITFSARAGKRSFGPFFVRAGGPYVLSLAFTDLSGRTKSLGWNTCLGSCARVPAPPPPSPPPPSPPPSPTPPPPATPPPPTPPVTSGPLKLTRGEATIVRRASGSNVTLHFTSNEPVTVVVSVLRNSNLVLKGLRFTYAAGPARIGPFAINRAGSYSFRLVANDSKGRNAALRWDVKIPAT